MLRAALFDLDDTLYPQSAFLRGAWTAVAARAAEWNIPAASFARQLAAVAAEGTDGGRIIDRALERLGRVDVPVAPLVDAFRAFAPDRLEPSPGVMEGLTAVGQRVPLGLVTDGWPDGQRAKLRALGLDGMFAVEVYSDDFGREHRKPAAMPFLHALAQLGVEPCDAVFVGDRPDKDVEGACSVGMRAIRVQSGEHAHQPTNRAGVAVVDTTADAIELLLQVTDVAAAKRGRGSRCGPFRVPHRSEGLGATRVTPG